ncbi:MAG: hypothetical protein QM597_02615 [Aeromicrobium sp.]|uniref:hypothetical protein n=1 Tax=Aeromicrobium sp. TaxID=1871063 RepID=UPI0039E34462
MSLGHPPPRSKKESSDVVDEIIASTFPEAPELTEVEQGVADEPQTPGLVDPAAGEESSLRRALAGFKSVGGRPVDEPSASAPEPVPAELAVDTARAALEEAETPPAARSAAESEEGLSPRQLAKKQRAEAKAARRAARLAAHSQQPVIEAEETGDPVAIEAATVEVPQAEEVPGGEATEEAAAGLPEEASAAVALAHPRDIRRAAQQKRRRARAEARQRRHDGVVPEAEAAEAALEVQVAEQEAEIVAAVAPEVVEVDVAEPEAETPEPEPEADDEPTIIISQESAEAEPVAETTDEPTAIIDLTLEQPVESKADLRRRKAEEKAAARVAKMAAKQQVSARPADDVPEPPAEVGPSSAGGSSRVTTIAAVVSALGLILSVVLAIGALLVALDAGSGGAFSVLSSVCDVLTAPVAGFIDFSGANADRKEALVTWGLGSMVYLVIGLAAQSLVRSRLDDD